MPRGILAIVNEDQYVDVEPKYENILDALEDIDAVLEEASEIEEQLEDIAVGEDAIATLESLSGSLDKMVGEDGEGIDDTTAEILRISVESVCVRLGLPEDYIEIETPSVEDVDGETTSNGIEVATEALKKIKSVTKAAIKALIDAVKKVFGVIIGFFTSFKTTGEKVIKATVTLEKKLAELDGKSPKDETLNQPGIAKAFAVGKGKLETKDVTDTLQNHIDITTGFSSKIKGFVKVAAEIETNAKDLEKGKVDEEGPSKLISISDLLDSIKAMGLDQPVSKGFEKKVSRIPKVDGTKISYKASKPLVGGLQLVSTAKTNKEKAVVDLSVTKDYPEKTYVKSTTEKVPVLNADDAGLVVKKVAELGEAMKKGSSVSGDLSKIKKSLDNALQSLTIVAKNTEAGNSETATYAKRVIKTTNKSIKILYKGINALASGIGSANPKAAKAALGYVNVSIKNHVEDSKDM